MEIIGVRLVNHIVTSGCGTSGYSGITAYPNYNCGGYLTVFPNPTKDELNIEITESSLKSLRDSLGQDLSLPRLGKSFEVRVYNSIGFLVKSAYKTGLIFSIPVGDLNEGNYIIEINDGKSVYRQQFMIKR